MSGKMSAKLIKFDVDEVRNDNYSDQEQNLDNNGNQNKEEDLNLEDTSDYTTEERNILFQRGLDYERNFKPNAALQCYLGYMKGLKNRNTFVHLPQCLHRIANIYRNQENYDRAAQFAQAEKLLNEANLCGDEEIQHKIDEIAEDSCPGPTDLNELNIDVLRADQYEHMAKICWLKKQNQLALEYAGFCAKLRQQVYGKKHEKTKVILNLFAAVYSELNKQQYQDSSSLNGEMKTDNDFAEDDSRTPEVIMSSPVGAAPVSILRQRSEDGSKDAEREKKQVRFHESVDENLRLKEKEKLPSVNMTLIQLTMCAVIIASIGMWLYCSMDKSQTCQSLVSQLNNWASSIQYYYHTISGCRNHGSNP